MVERMECSTSRSMVPVMVAWSSTSAPLQARVGLVSGIQMS